MPKFIEGYVTVGEAGKILGLSQPQITRLINSVWVADCISLGGGRKRVGQWLIPRVVVEGYRPRKERKK